MANTNAPSGFKPIKSASGGSKLQVDYFQVASGTARIGKGDLVALLSTGYLARETSATAVGPWMGVAMIGMSSSAGVGGITQFPVCCDPSAIYEVQGPTSALAQTDIGRVVKANCGSAPDTNTNISKDVLTNTDASSSNGVAIIRLANRPDNTLAASAVLEVRLNKLQSAPGFAGI